MSTDIGERAARLIWDVLQIDDEWAVETSRGFWWWAHDVAQEVVARKPEPLEGDGEPGARVVVRTPILSRPSAGKPAVLRALAVMNGCSTGGALRQAADGTIVHELAATVTDETVEGLSRLLATGAILALTEGVEAAEALAPALGARVQRSVHPTRGSRRDRDDILNVTDAIVLPTGRGPSRWAGAAELFASAARTLNKSGRAYAADEEGEHGLLCEFGFGDHQTSLAMVVPSDEDGCAPAGPGLPGAGPDPRLGAGMLGWLLLPGVLPPEAGAETADRLNRREGDPGPDAGFMPYHLGAWTLWNPDGRCTVAYRVFVPNVLAGLVTPISLAENLWLHGTLASEELLPDEVQLEGDHLYDFLMRRIDALADGRGLAADGHASRAPGGRS